MGLFIESPRRGKEGSAYTHLNGSTSKQSGKQKGSQSQEVVLQGQVNQWMTYRYKAKTITLTPTQLLLGPRVADPNAKVDEYCLEALTVLPSRKPHLLVLQSVNTRASVTSRLLQNSKETLYLQFSTAAETRNWQNHIEKQKGILLEPPAFQLAAKGSHVPIQSLRRVRNKVLAVMDKVVTRQISSSRRLEYLGASEEVIALFEEECQHWLQDVGEILDEIDYKERRRAPEEDVNAQEFLSCASKHSQEEEAPEEALEVAPEEAPEEAGFASAPPEEGNKFNITKLAIEPDWSNYIFESKRT